MADFGPILAPLVKARSQSAPLNIINHLPIIGRVAILCACRPNQTHPLMSRPNHRWGTPLALMGAVAFALQTAPSLQASSNTSLSTPYSNNSAIEDHLDFPTNAIARPAIPSPLSAVPLPGAGLATSTTPGVSSATANSLTWALSAQGSSMVYLAGLPATGIRAETNINGGTLNFTTNQTGVLGDLISLSLAPLSWTATTTFNPVGFAAGNYAYEFDFSYMGGALTLNPGLANNFNVKILEGTTTRYDSSTAGGLIPNLLALNLGGVLTGTSAQNARLPFFYSGVGNLTIEFTASQTLSVNALNAISSNPIYSISNGDIGINPVPEPSSMILVGMGALLLLRRRRDYTA